MFLILDMDQQLHKLMVIRKSLGLVFNVNFANLMKISNMALENIDALPRRK